MVARGWCRKRKDPLFMNPYSIRIIEVDVFIRIYIRLFRKDCTNERHSWIVIGPDRVHRIRTRRYFLIVASPDRVYRVRAFHRIFLSYIAHRGRGHIVNRIYSGGAIKKDRIVVLACSKLCIEVAN